MEEEKNKYCAFYSKVRLQKRNNPAMFDRPSPSRVIEKQFQEILPSLTKLKRSPFDSSHLSSITVITLGCTLKGTRARGTFRTRVIALLQGIVDGALLQGQKESVLCLTRGGRGTGLGGGPRWRRCWRMICCGRRRW